MLTGCGAKEDEQPAIRTLDDVNGKRMGMVVGSSYEQAVRERFPDSEIVIQSSYGDCLVALTSGKVDAYVTEEPQAKVHMGSVPGIAYFQEKLVEEQYGFMYAKESTQLRDQIDEALADLEAEGILAALQDKWFDNKGDYDVGTAPDASAPSWTSTPAPMLRRFATSRMTKSPATSRTS